MKSGNIRAHKGDIAMQLLKDARAMYDLEHYFSAIHLAAGASEVLCTLCEIYDKPSPHLELKKMLKDFHDSDPSFFGKPQQMLNSFYAAKNTVKHLNKAKNDEIVVLNAEMRSRLYINQACKAASALGIEHELALPKFRPV